MRQEIDAKTQYLLQNQSLIEEQKPEVASKVAENLMAFANFIDCLNHYAKEPESETKP